MSIVTVDPRIAAELLAERMTAMLQGRLDAFARTRHYAHIASTVSYADSTIPQFAAEGRRASLLRDQTWAQAAAILADVQAGKRAVTSEAELIAELPALTWE